MLLLFSSCLARTCVATIVTGGRSPPIDAALPSGGCFASAEPESEQVPFLREAEEHELVRGRKMEKINLSPHYSISRAREEATKDSLLCFYAFSPMHSAANLASRPRARTTTCAAAPARGRGGEETTTVKSAANASSSPSSFRRSTATATPTPANEPTRRAALAAAVLSPFAVVAHRPLPARAIQGLTAGRIPGLSSKPGADGLFEYRRPEG